MLNCVEISQFVLEKTFKMLKVQTAGQTDDEQNAIRKDHRSPQLNIINTQNEKNMSEIVTFQMSGRLNCPYNWTLEKSV